MILEELEHARRRGAKIYAELVGYGMSGDAFHISAPCEDGDGAIRVMKATLEDAGVAPDVVDYINVHGTSTPRGDVVEVIAAKAVFGEHARRLALSSTKSMTGHLLGAAGGSRPASRRSSCATRSCRRPSTSTTPTPIATSTACPIGRARPRSSTRSATRSGSAARTGRCSSGASTNSGDTP